jgi:MFS family permease
MMSALKITAFVYSGIILLIYFYQNFYLWLVLAFVMGACWFAYTITRQSWLNILLEDSQRGVATGIFSMTISVGLALGPIIVKFSGADNYFSFVIAAVLAFTSFLCLLPLRNKPQPILEAKRIGLKEFFKNNPRCFMARFFLDFQTYLLFSFTVIFGVKIGLSYEAAGLLITAYMASALFDLGVGFSLKKFNPYRLIKFGFLGCASCFLAIILIRSYPALVAIYFLFGICIACIYVSVFKVCNDDYDKEKLVAANATFQLIGSSGSLFGSLLGAILVEYFGINGFPCAMVLSCVFYLTFLAFYEKN